MCVRTAAWGSSCLWFLLSQVLRSDVNSTIRSSDLRAQCFPVACYFSSHFWTLCYSGHIFFHWLLCSLFSGSFSSRIFPSFTCGPLTSALAYPYPLLLLFAGAPKASYERLRPQGVRFWDRFRAACCARLSRLGSSFTSFLDNSSEICQIFQAPFSAFNLLSFPPLPALKRPLGADSPALPQLHTEIPRASAASSTSFPCHLATSYQHLSGLLS